MNISFFLISDGWGGAENVVYNLAKFMEKKGYNISIILNDETYPYFKDLGNVNLYNVGPMFDYEKLLEANFGISIPLFFSGLGIFSKGLRLFLGPLLKHLNYRKIKGNVLETINRINPDIIHFHNPIVLEFYSYIYRELKAPKIYTGHVKDYDIPFRNQPIIKEIKLKKLMESFSHVTAVSEYVKRKLMRKNIRFSKEIRVINNGIYIPDFHNVEGEPLPNNFNICFAGGTKEDKGGDIVIKSIEILQSSGLDFHLYITKEVPKNHKYRNLVKNLGLENKVTFLGFVPSERYFSLLKSMDVFVMPTKIEGFPMLYLEAMALGIPIISTPAGGTAELVKHKRNGLYVERNPDDVAEKILYLYKNSELRRGISKNNIQDVKKFDLNNIINQYNDLYRSLMISK